MDEKGFARGEVEPDGRLRQLRDSSIRNDEQDEEIRKNFHDFYGVKNDMRRNDSPDFKVTTVQKNSR